MIEKATLVALIDNARQALTDLEAQRRVLKQDLNSLLRERDALDEADGRTLEGMSTLEAAQVALRALGDARPPAISAYVRGRGLDRSRAVVAVALHRLKARGEVERTGLEWRIAE